MPCPTHHSSPYSTLPYLTLPYPGLLYPTLLCPIIPYSALLCRVMYCNGIPCIAMPYPTLPCLIPPRLLARWLLHTWVLIFGLKWHEIYKILSIQKYLLKDARNYCLKNISIYYAEYEPARTCTITWSCYFVYTYFHFSTLIVLLMHNYIDYSILFSTHI